ncbi:MAG TPA: DUF1684 domain-containing protein [Parapedobacter sp.]|uniref:DUF1684 domain-containing protein n=1 Tax=Parapedobacter sp. TaxID=1958893 RepID=UPI002C8CFA83|nr:DUF1684 domain-containing protein [Parapedobacter sp.]HWK57620.1 DUF1684 domain-containing protein [Parapedobacter sp.]
MFNSFISKLIIATMALSCVVQLVNGQYSLDSIRTLRQLKLERLAKDPSAPLTADDIRHIHHYDPDSIYVVPGRVELLRGELPFRMPTSDGTSKTYIRYAKVRFQLQGQDGELTLFRSQDLFTDPRYRNHLFLPFTDETNGDETYGAGRYIDLSIDDIQNGSITIDFNTAYNPYCAYSSGYRCPLPPVENFLPVPIKAGEKSYTGPIRERPQPLAVPKPLSTAEHELVLSGDTTQLMRVIQDTVAVEEAVLRKPSVDINPDEPLLPLLAKRMYLSVMDSLHPGVGIAAPQVGINRNVIWVQRFDKPGEPMELYLNPKITWRSKLLRKGLEGCLSIPDTMGQVLRNYTIRLTYQDSDGAQHEEMIEGFTAVIFQHETDHLHGVLFTDRLAEQEQGTYNRINGETDLYLKERLRRQ